MELYEQGVTDDEIIRGSFGDPRLRGPFWQNGGWFFDLDYSAEAEAELRPVVNARTQLGALPRRYIPIQAALAQELGLPINPQDSTATV